MVDDHPSMRMGLIALINGQLEMEVIAEASDGEEAIEVYEDVLPDIVLMDLRMPGMGGVEATLAIRKKFPEANVIILSTYDWDEDIHLAINPAQSPIFSKTLQWRILPIPFAKLLREIKRFQGRWRNVWRSGRNGNSSRSVSVMCSNI